MHAQTSGQRLADEREEKPTQRAMLALVLHEHPKQISREDMGFFGLERGEPVQRAIENLVTVGLVWCEGPFVLPTLAARHFDWLELP